MPRSFCRSNKRVRAWSATVPRVPSARGVLFLQLVWMLCQILDDVSFVKIDTCSDVWNGQFKAGVVINTTATPYFYARNPSLASNTPLLIARSPTSGQITANPSQPRILARKPPLPSGGYLRYFIFYLLFWMEPESFPEWGGGGRVTRNYGVTTVAENCISVKLWKRYFCAGSRK